MTEHIRYGSEVNVHRAIGQTRPEVLELIKDFSGNILSFSNGVRHLPDEPDFKPLLGELGFATIDDKSADSPVSQGEVFMFGTRVIEVIEAPPTNYEVTRLLAAGLVRLAVDSGRLGDNDVVFFDHTTRAAGIIIDSSKRDLV